MTATDLMGWAAAAMTLLAFTSRDVHLLRLASLGASVAFITYATATATWPVLALHTVMLPVNLRRLFELRRAGRSSREKSGQCNTSMTCDSGKTARRTSRRWRRLALVALAVVSSAMPTAAAPTCAECIHARAVESCRQDQVPESMVASLARAGAR